MKLRNDNGYNTCDKVTSATKKKLNFLEMENKLLKQENSEKRDSLIIERKSKEKKIEQNFILKEKLKMAVKENKDRYGNKDLELIKLRDENVSLKEHLKKLVATDSEVENEMDNMNRIYVIPSLTSAKENITKDDRVKVVEGEQVDFNKERKMTKKKQKRLNKLCKFEREREEMFDKNILF